MRISDWSSDVCSSDLRPGGEACGHCRSCRLFGARAQRDPVEVRPDGSLAHPDGHSSHPDLLLVGYEWKLRPSPAKQRRSEEHTSELQSLMRNSYAVFCLKKKTNKISIHYHHIYVI